MTRCYLTYDECKYDTPYTCFLSIDTQKYCPASYFNSQHRAAYCFSSQSQCVQTYGQDCLLIQKSYCHKSYEYYIEGWNSNCVDYTLENKELCTVFCGEVCEPDFPWGYCCGKGVGDVILILGIVLFSVACLIAIIVGVSCYRQQRKKIKYVKISQADNGEQQNAAPSENQVRQYEQQIYQQEANIEPPDIYDDRERVDYLPPK